MSDTVSLLSRILMSVVFIVYGYFKLVDVASIVNNAGTKRFMEIVAAGAAAPTWLGYLIAIIEVGGGLLILIGFKTRWVAWAMVLWIVLITLLGHPFWLMEGAPRGPNMLNFYKNLGILAAYLMLAIHGPGRYSVDRG